SRDLPAEANRLQHRPNGAAIVLSWGRCHPAGNPTPHVSLYKPAGLDPVLAQIRLDLKRVIESVCEIRGAYHQRQLDNLVFGIILPEVLERPSPDAGSAPGYALGIQQSRLFLLVKEIA